MLQINELKVYYHRGGTETRAVDGVRLKMPHSTILALVGESGCGKTTLGLSITDLINPRDGKIISGSIIFEGKNLLRLPRRQLCEIRGRDISYIFQEPATSFNPVFTIGEQIRETLLIHKITDKRMVKGLVMDSLTRAGLKDCERVFNSYPHQLSGGMKQRAMIAMAICTSPKLLVADEPTTALDINTQAKILELFTILRKEMSLSILIITHDIRIVKQIADKTAIMYQGKITEVGDTDRIFNSPRHPYTKMLLDALP